MSMQRYHKSFRNPLASIPTAVRASAVYVIASVLAKGLTFITTPIFTRLMPPEEVGVVSLFASWQSMLSGIACLSLSSGGLMLAMKEFANDRDNYLSSLITLISFVSCPYLLLTLFIPETIANFTGLPSSLCTLMAAGFMVTPAVDCWLGRQRYEYKYQKAGLYIILSSLLSAIISVGSVVWMSNNRGTNLAEVRLISGNGVLYLCGLVIWLGLLIRGKEWINIKYWKYSLALALPLVGNSVASQVMSTSDRIMIANMVGNYEVGIYGTLYSVSSIALLVWNAINNSYVPFLFENIDRPNGAIRIRRTTNTLMLSFGCVTLLVSLMAPEIVKVLATDEYYMAINLIPPIMGGTFIVSISNLYSNILVFHKKTTFIMVSSILGAICNICLNYVGIPRFGYGFAAYSTLVSYAVLGISQTIVASHIHGRLIGTAIYDGKCLTATAMITIIACLLCIELYNIGIIPRLIISVIALLLLTYAIKRISYNITQ